VDILCRYLVRVSLIGFSVLDLEMLQNFAKL